MAKKKKKIEWAKSGHFAFIAGLILAIIAGFFPFGVKDVITQEALIDSFRVLFAVLGIVVGFLNITRKEVTSLQDRDLPAGY